MNDKLLTGSHFHQNLPPDLKLELLGWYDDVVSKKTGRAHDKYSLLAVVYMKPVFVP